MNSISMSAKLRPRNSGTSSHAQKKVITHRPAQTKAALPPKFAVSVLMRYGVMKFMAQLDKALVIVPKLCVFARKRTELVSALMVQLTAPTVGA